MVVLLFPGTKMPLRVHCPSGCFVRMPVNRAGKVVRCPECKRVIRLHGVTQTEIKSGKSIPMTATSVEDAKIVVEDPSIILPSIDATSADLEPESIDRPRLMVPEKIAPTSVRTRNKVSDTRPKQKKQSTPSARQAPSSVKYASLGNEPFVPDLVKPADKKVELRQRVRASNADRKMILKFFAVCLCVVGAVNLAPAIYYWVQWSQNVDSPALPRWIYLQAFVAAVHVIYAVYLIQIPDWSTLKTVSIAMLVVATLFGLVSTGLVTGGGQGTVARFLELPHVLSYRASIWCVAMLLLSTLMCYMGGREAVNWQRTEQLLREIVS